MVLLYRKRKHLYSHETWRHKRVFKKEILTPISEWYREQYSVIQTIMQRLNATYLIPSIVIYIYIIYIKM